MKEVVPACKGGQASSPEAVGNDQIIQVALAAFPPDFSCHVCVRACHPHTKSWNRNLSFTPNPAPSPSTHTPPPSPRGSNLKYLSHENYANFLVKIRQIKIIINKLMKEFRKMNCEAQY